MKNKTSAKIKAFAAIVKNYREAQNYKTENALYNAIQEIGWQRYNASYRNSLTKEPAEEALNDVALAVFRLPFSDDNYAYQYVVTCCRNAFKDELRKKKKYSNTDSYSVTENCEPEAKAQVRGLEKKVLDLADTKDDDWCVPMEHLEKVLATLSGKDKLVATETFNGLKPGEISKKHGLKIGDVYNHKHSAQEKIKRKINGLGL